MRRWGERAFAIGWCVLLLAGGIAGGTAAGSVAGSAVDGPSVAAGESVGERQSAGETNRAPMADAGLDQQVQVNTTVHLDATGSYDPDGSIVRYEWRVEHPDGNYSTPACETCARTQFIADERGVYEVTVTVTDDDGAQRSDTLRVNVTGAGGPTVHLRGPRRIRPATDYEYTVDATAGEEGLARVLWFVDDRRVETTSVTGESATAKLSRRFAAGTTHTLRVEVVDWVGLRAVDRLRVTVGNGSSPSPTHNGSGTNRTTGSSSNVPPTVAPSADSPVEGGERVVLVGGVTDPDGDPLTYNWTQIDGSPLTLGGEETETARFTAPDVTSSREYAFRLRVSDGTAMVSETVEVRVVPDGRPPEEPPRESTNEPPQVSASAESPVRPGETVSLDGEASDRDGDLLTVEWSQVGESGLSITGSESEDASFVAPHVSSNSSFEVRFEADDGSTTRAETVTVRVVPPSSPRPTNGSESTNSTEPTNRPPTASATATSPVRPGETVSLTGRGSDPDGDSLTYRWSQVGGSALSIANSSSRNASFVAPTVSTRTGYEVRLTVSDGNATATANATVVVEPATSTPETPLVVNASARSPVRPGETVTLDGEVTGAEEAPTQKWIQSGGPDVAIENADREDATVTAPDVDRIVELEFLLLVTAGNESGFAEVTVVVRPVNLPPDVNATARSPVTSGETVTLGGTASDRDGDPLSFEWSTQSSVGIDDARSEDASFVAPNVSATTNYTFELSASDGTASESDEVTVTVEPPNRPPEIGANAESPVISGEIVRLRGTGYDLDGDSLSFEWTARSSDIGIIGAETEDARFVAPKVTSQTGYVFYFSVSDGTTNRTVTEVVTVKPANRPPNADASTNSPVKAGETVELNGVASDMDDSSLNYSWFQPSASDFSIRDNHSERASFVAPDVSSRKVYEVVFQVSDGTTTRSTTVYVTVTPENDSGGAGIQDGNEILDREGGCLTGAGSAGAGAYTCNDEVRFLETGEAELVDNNLDNEIRYRGVIVKKLNTEQGPITTMNSTKFRNITGNKLIKKMGKSDNEDNSVIRQS